MRKAILASFFIVLAATAVWSQQAPAPAPGPAPAPIVRDPHSTSADLVVPLCPANSDDDIISTDGNVHPPDRDVTPPKATHIVDAKFSDEARRQKRFLRAKRFQATLSLIVNVDGEPENVCLMQSAGYGLDAEAAKAVQQYRFAPATKNGKPVPVRLHIRVDFKLY